MSVGVLFSFVCTIGVSIYWNMTMSRYERVGMGLALVGSALVYLVLRLNPSIDPMWNQREFHFYIVTYASLVALVSGIYIFFAVGQSDVEPLFLTLAFIIMAGIFFTHGYATPGIVLGGPNVAVGWSARLSLTAGAILIVLALRDYSDVQRERIMRYRLNIWIVTMIGFVAYVGLIFGVPEPFQRLSEIENSSLIFAAITISLLGWATYKTWKLHQQQPKTLYKALLVALPWLAFAQISQYEAPLWLASWWLYHVWMLAAYILTMVTLIYDYERTDDFRANWYFISLGLVLSVPLAFILAETAVFATEREDLRWSFFGYVASALFFLLFALFTVVNRAQHIMTRRAEAIEQEKQWRIDMTNLIAHDLKSPLNSILLNLDTLITRDETITGKTRERLLRTQTSAKTMVELIFDMLDVERMEAGILTLDRSSINLHEIVAASINTVQTVADVRDITIHSHIPTILPKLNADEKLIQRVLQNLLSNAIKFTPVDGTVKIGATLVGQFAQIQVDDTGPGIPKDQRDLIFDKFGQVNVSDQRQGYGLGLAFCKLAVEQHGGSIRVEESGSGGSRFIFTLPVT